MKVIVGIAAAGLLLFAADPAAGGVAWSDCVEGAYPVGAEDECKFIPDPPWDTMEPQWLAGPNSAREFINAGSVGPDGDWAYGKESWAGDSYDLSMDPTKKTCGDVSLRCDPESGSYCDIFIVREFPTEIGQEYEFCFDLALDAGLLDGLPPGQMAGDDHQSSVSWQIRNTVENVLESTGLGRQSPAAIADTEDYPGHLRNSIWIGDPAMWDGQFYTHSIEFTAEGDWAVFALKLRSHNADVDSGMNIDNLVLIPEPASLMLLALGGLAVLRRRCR